MKPSVVTNSHHGLFLNTRRVSQRYSVVPQCAAGERVGSGTDSGAGYSRRRSEIIKDACMIGIGYLMGLQPSSARAAEDLVTTTLDPLAQTATVGDVVLSTLSDCSLAVSVYPKFSYNASGGGGRGRVVSQEGDILHVEFDANTLNIPPIDYASTKVIGVPIPPPLQIRIIPKELKGTVNRRTGETNLNFDALFQFDAGSLYHAKPLSVATTLSTEGSSGTLLRGSGARMMNGSGKAKLAGVAQVPKTGDGFLDSFLLLPSEALAVLSADLTFT